MQPEALFIEIRRLRETGVAMIVELILRDGRKIISQIKDVLCDILLTYDHVPFRSDEILIGYLDYF